ncbi:hypothetical protein Pse7429DRAFT_1444 [Pseudanabaena biceps PCC 7429]|uniref:Uncharacterized protein n=1 Tax=Pseudanabaena biceps PCC 7429 TaxID=927668 RepID=L8N5G8_9CYAN|nr:hypothetical protein Pse7429DRAFT_1444 [Pseudanabaena biceps PCC 7429]
MQKFELLSNHKYKRVPKQLHLYLKLLHIKHGYHYFGFYQSVLLLVDLVTGYPS